MNSTMASRRVTLMSSASQMKLTVSTVPWMMLKTPGGMPACKQAPGAPISASAQLSYSLQSYIVCLLGELGEDDRRSSVLLRRLE